MSSTRRIMKRVRSLCVLVGLAGLVWLPTATAHAQAQVDHADSRMTLVQPADRVPVDTGEKAECETTSEPRRTVPSTLRDSLAHLRYEPLSVTSTASQEPRHDWSRLRQLEGSEIVLRAQGLSARKCRLVAVEDAALTAVDLDSPSRTTLRIARADVDEVSQWIGRRGSTVGAVIGAAAGFVAGALVAQQLAFKQCGRSCSDEKFLIGLSLVGTPIAGGFLGYRLPGDRRTLTTIYVRP